VASLLRWLSCLILIVELEIYGQNQSVGSEA
jgi:hypothetical protein